VRRLMGVSMCFNAIDGVEMIVIGQRDVASVTAGCGL